MTDATITRTDDVIAFLKYQHEEIKRLFAETLQATDAKARERSFYRLRRLLAVHETAEEIVVHPLARRKLAFGEGIVDARLSEEKEAKVHLAALEKMDPDSAEFRNALTELQSAVVDHAEHEETEEFAKLYAELDDNDLKRAAAMVELSEKIAPTRPHASVQGATANVIAGPFAAMLDRVRDAFKDVS